MIDEIYQLIIFITISVIINYNISKKIVIRTKTDIHFIMEFVLLCIIIPITEESVFRCTLKQFIDSRIINASLFGLVHSINYFSTNNKLGVIYQVCMTSILGYYLSGIGNISYCILIHSLYNMVNMVALYFYGEKLEKKDILSPGNKIFISHDKIRKSKSCINLNSSKFSQSKISDIYTIPDILIESSKKFYDYLKKNNYKQLKI